MTIHVYKECVGYTCTTYVTFMHVLKLSLTQRHSALCPP